MQAQWREYGTDLAAVSRRVGRAHRDLIGKLGGVGVGLSGDAGGGTQDEEVRECGQGATPHHPPAPTHGVYSTGWLAHG